MRAGDVIKQYAEGMIGRSEAELSKFKARLEDSPVYAFEWSGSAIKAAATLVIGQDLKRAVEGGMSAQSVVDWVEAAVLNEANYADNFSTSMVSNLVMLAKVSARAALLRWLKGSDF